MDIKNDAKYINKYQLVTSFEKFKCTEKRVYIGAHFTSFGSVDCSGSQSVDDGFRVKFGSNSDIKKFSDALDSSMSQATKLREDIPVEIAESDTPVAVGIKGSLAAEIKSPVPSRVVGIPLDYLLSLLKTNRRSSNQ